MGGHTQIIIVISLISVANSSAVGDGNVLFKRCVGSHVALQNTLCGNPDLLLNRVSHSSKGQQVVQHLVVHWLLQSWHIRQCRARPMQQLVANTDEAVNHAPFGVHIGSKLCHKRGLHELQCAVVGSCEASCSRITKASSHCINNLEERGSVTCMVVCFVWLWRYLGVGVL